MANKRAICSTRILCRNAIGLKPVVAPKQRTSWEREEVDFFGQRVERPRLGYAGAQSVGCDNDMASDDAASGKPIL
ncbi:MAG: hypothetical protein ACRDNS_32150 [Trebonia sp.]